MSDKERLAEAEALLREVDKMVYSHGVTERIRTFLNHESDIDWAKVPNGTTISQDGLLNTFAYKNDDKTIIDSCGDECLIAGCTIPPQSSHIHKCLWPSDGNQPDWVKQDTQLLVKDSSYSAGYGLLLAYQVDWNLPRKWFAVLKPTSYRRDLE